jgi:hypothetical protein
MTKQIKQPIANPTHVITTDGTDQISEVGHSTLSVVKEALSLDAVPNLDTTDAVNKAHDQNTDTALDLGNANEVTAADARAHIDATDNPHNVTATQVGLGDVDNVSAADLRDRTTHTGEQAISTVTGLQSTLDDKADKTTTFTAGVGLDGGGDLSANRTFDLDSSTQSSLGLADTALQPGDPATDVSYDNTTSGLAATDVQGAIDDAVDSFVGRKEQIAQGFIQREGTRGDLDVDLAVAIELNLLGAPVAGGYYAGLIDTLTGNIIAADDYQTGLRYALIVSDKSLEGGRGSSPASGLPTGDLEWDTQDRGGEAGAFTRWNGLEATDVIIAKNDTSYEAHDFIEAVRSQYPAATTPGGSEWYLPAMDELELLYRNFKPNNADNRDDTRNRVFPGTQVVGTNPSSAIEGFQYENNPRIPDVTFLDLFKEGNAQAIDLNQYWSTTDADEGGRAWRQTFTFSGVEGFQAARDKDVASSSVRPVRRVVL